MKANHPANPQHLIEDVFSQIFSTLGRIGETRVAGAPSAKAAGCALTTDLTSMLETHVQKTAKRIVDAQGDLSARMEPFIVEAAEKRPQQLIGFDQNGFKDMGELNPMLENAIDIGSDLKVLDPSPEESEYVSSWESILMPCLVKDLHPGYVVVKLAADSFADLDPDVDSSTYIVTSISSLGVILKDCSNYLIPFKLTDQEQSVLVVNEYGLDNVGEDVSELVWPVKLSAPGLWERQQLLSPASSLVQRR